MSHCPLEVWVIIARCLGEEAIVLALALRDADERLGDAVYHIAEDYHLASLEASQELE
jgi:hypothetical protein